MWTGNFFIKEAQSPTSRRGIRIRRFRARNARAGTGRVALTDASREAGAWGSFKRTARSGR